MYSLLRPTFLHFTNKRNQNSKKSYWNKQAHPTIYHSNEHEIMKNWELTHISNIKPIGDDRQPTFKLKNISPVDFSLNFLLRRFTLETAV